MYATSRTFAGSGVLIMNALKVTNFKYMKTFYTILISTWMTTKENFLYRRSVYKRGHLYEWYCRNLYADLGNLLVSDKNFI